MPHSEPNVTVLAGAPGAARGRDEEKAREELEVFKLFARQARMHVIPETIEQSKSAPDIRCTLENGEILTTELVRLDSEATSRRFSDVYSAPAADVLALRGLPEEERDLYLARYAGAVISVEWSRNLRKRERISQHRALIDLLRQQPTGFTGALESDAARVSVARPPGRRTGGPIVSTSSTVRSDPVIWSRVRDKLKRYKLGGRFELLAYSLRDWLNDAIPDADIREWLRGSSFARVWILECVSKRVCRRIDRPIQ